MEISVIIPTYRPKNYLWDCLRSIDRQTFDHSNFEVILVLNGEREPYEQQIASFVSGRLSFQCRLIYNEEVGVSAARNCGLDEALGKYICFIDDDDIITEDYLKQLYKYSDSDTVSLSYITAFEDGSEINKPIYITENFQSHHNKIPYTQARRYFYTPWCKMIHRDIIGTRRFDTSLKNGEDALFMLLISDRIKWVRFTDKSAEYRYRQRSTSAFNTPRPLSYHMSNMLQRLIKATRVFFLRPFSYSFSFYIKYMLATVMGCLRQVSS